MLPYRIDRSFRMPWATLGLIGVNFLLFGLSLATGLDKAIDALGFRVDVLAPITWLTASFLHADVLHIAGNMYFLWLFGSIVEDALGPVRLVGLYLLGGLAAAAAHGTVIAVCLPEGLAVPVVGASGALAAIMGLFAVRFYKTRIRVWYIIWLQPGTFAVSSVVGVALWFARDLLDGVVGILSHTIGGVANWAHLGGAVFGAGVGLWSGQIRSATQEYLAEDARTWATAGAHEIAAARYSELTDSEPHNPDWHRRRARSLMQSRPPAIGQATQDFAEALRLSLLARDVPEALDTYIEADGWLGPPVCDPRALVNLGAEAERRFDTSAAESLYRRVIDETDDAAVISKALFRLAHVQVNAGRPEDAARTWRAFKNTRSASDWIGFADPVVRALDELA